jgi:hypothetical protein
MVKALQPLDNPFGPRVSPMSSVRSDCRTTFGIGTEWYRCGRGS